jgi:two-component system, NtrC family, sensor histidine kinase HydH
MLTKNARKVGLITGSLALIAFLHYLAPLTHPFYHELFARLYYFPIFLGGLWFGIWGGVRVSLLVTIIYVPHIFLGWHPDPSLFYDKLLEVALFNLAGPTVGYLADRERRQRYRNQEIQNLAAIGEAAASSAHEIKNMVIPIRGFVRRIREGCKLEGECGSYMEIVEHESARLEEMAQDMLSLTRRAPLMKESVDLGALLQEIHQDMHDLFRQRGVHLSTRCEDSACRVSLDRERIRQALLNLLHNALHASSKDREVRLLAAHGGDRLQIVVEDEGEGIPKENLDRIFLPFFTTKPKGTGLGLAISQEIVRLHGGVVRVESKPGKGTRFVMDFPVSQDLDSLV